MAILSKGCKPDTFEQHNSLKLSFANIRGLHLNFVDCESFLASKSPDILALCQTNVDDSDNFSVSGYLPLIRKDSITHMHGLVVYVKEGLPFARAYLQKTLRIPTSVLDWLYFTQCLSSFSPINHLLCRYARLLILFNLTQMRLDKPICCVCRS